MRERTAMDPAMTPRRILLVKQIDFGELEELLAAPNGRPET
jgi:hypothetical protein